MSFFTDDAVARRTGFRHGEYLSVVFQRELRMNPGEYRDRCRR